MSGAKMQGNELFFFCRGENVVMTVFHINRFIVVWQLGPKAKRHLDTEENKERTRSARVVKRGGGGGH